MTTRIALVVAVFLLLTLSGCCELPRGFVFPAPSESREPRFGALLEMRDRDRVCVASYVRAFDDMPTIVHFHGNAQQIADLEHLADDFADRGFGFLAVEYPGYGVADGSPNEESIYACAEIALRRLATMGVPRSRVVLEGHSIGTGVAVEMARRGLGAKVVLVSPYTSMPELFEKLGAPASLACDRFDSASKAPTIAVPVLIVHGTADALIPASMGTALASRFPHATLKLVDGGGHNDLFSTYRTEVFAAILAFAAAPLADHSRLPGGFIPSHGS